MSSNKKHALVRQDVGSHLTELSDQDRARVRMLGNEMGQAYGEKVRFYQHLHKTYPDEECYKGRYDTGAKVHAAAIEPANDERYQRVLQTRAEELGWDDLQVVLERDESEAVAIWHGVLDVAKEKLESGILACETLSRVDGNPFERAQFLVIRDSLVSAWQPKDAIEMSMVEMLVQAFISYHYWLRLANSMARREYEAAEEIREDRYGKRKEWNPPKISVADAIDRAVNMADRFNRLYLRTLRQMRDLRRYAQPVIVNNAGQVNVATNGGQQVNVQNKSKKKNSARSLKRV